MGDEVMGIVDSQAVKAYVAGFMGELPTNDPPTPLMFAVMQGHSDAVRMLLLDGKEPNEVDEHRNGKTPLHAAAESLSFHSAEICRLLLGAKAEVGACDNAGDTALHIAARVRSLDVVRALLNEGADRNQVAIPKY